jgi:hypothetical protein
MDTSVRWTPGESWPSTHRRSQCIHDARNSYASYVPIGYQLLGRYLDKAYNSVPGGVGSNPLMAFLRGLCACATTPAPRVADAGYWSCKTVV